MAKSPARVVWFRVWISGQKETTMVFRQFASAFNARMFLANRYGLKTYDVVAQRVSEPVQS